MRRHATLVLLLLAAACKPHDPRSELEVSMGETYWVLDSPAGGTSYMAPAVRFRVRNRSAEPVRSIQANANFRRVGEEENWGSAWTQVTEAGHPLEPGKEVEVVVRSEGRYTSTGTAESMFAHELFKDARVTLYLRVGSSPWTKMAEADIERRIGSKTVEHLGTP
jgi:hypothetical protein